MIVVRNDCIGASFDMRVWAVNVVKEGIAVIRNFYKITQKMVFEFLSETLDRHSFFSLAIYIEPRLIQR